MLRNVFLSLVIVTVAVTSSSAGILSADGDFGSQTIGSVVGSPWNPVGGGPAASASSQSPFTNAFDDNGVGAHILGGGYIVGTFNAQTVTTAPMLYLNFDAILNETDLEYDCSQRFALAFNQGERIMFEAFLGTKSLLVSDGYAGHATVTSELKANTWYNLQFAFDLNAMT